MNRYLIAALYVMAGCVVAVPLKIQGNPEPLKAERCRLVISATVKVVSAYLEDEEVGHLMCGYMSEECNYPEICTEIVNSYWQNQIIFANSPLYYTSHKIRAPEIA